MYFARPLPANSLIMDCIKPYNDLARRPKSCLAIMLLLWSNLWLGPGGAPGSREAAAPALTWPRRVGLAGRSVRQA